MVFSISSGLHAYECHTSKSPVTKAISLANWIRRHISRLPNNPLPEFAHSDPTHDQVEAAGALLADLFHFFNQYDDEE